MTRRDVGSPPRDLNHAHCGRLNVDPLAVHAPDFRQGSVGAGAVRLASNHAAPDPIHRRSSRAWPRARVPTCRRSSTPAPAGASRPRSSPSCPTAPTPAPSCGPAPPASPPSTSGATPARTARRLRRPPRRRRRRLRPRLRRARRLDAHPHDELPRLVPRSRRQPPPGAARRAARHPRHRAGVARGARRRAHAHRRDGPPRPRRSASTTARCWRRPTVPIRPDDTLETLTARVHDAEHELLVDTLATLCRQEVRPMTTQNDELFDRFEALTFDDVVIVPGYSETLPDTVDTTATFAAGITLAIPLVSAAMDKVTESRMAIAMARHGRHRRDPPQPDDRRPGRRGAEGQAQPERDDHRPRHAAADGAAARGRGADAPVQVLRRADHRRRRAARRHPHQPRHPVLRGRRLRPPGRRVHDGRPTSSRRPSARRSTRPRRSCSGTASRSCRSSTTTGAWPG